MEDIFNLKFMDFCAGIGGGRLGLTNLGLQCVAYSEIDGDAEKTYQTFYGSNEVNYGDLMQINAAELPDFDLMIGGFPCQPFSTVGKREGFEDERGQVIFGLMKILKEKNVPYFILENVKGLVFHDNGETLRTILAEFDKSGYDVEWKVLNSKDYGVPQSRERIYLVGIRKDIPHKPLEWKAYSGKSVALKDCLQRLHGESVNIFNQSWQHYLHSDLNNGKFSEDALLQEDYLIIDRRNRGVRTYIGKSPTLRKSNHGLFYVHSKKLYKINGYQGLLLQGFPKEFVTKAKQAKLNPNKILGQAGNAMTVNVISYVCQTLLASIK